MNNLKRITNSITADQLTMIIDMLGEDELLGFNFCKDKCQKNWGGHCTLTDEELTRNECRNQIKIYLESKAEK